jgi:MoaA/NifB/PqqE/SkfB family radical SAM enzyme
MTLERFNNRDYVSITMEYRCNLRCTHCMIEGTMDRLRPESLQTFADLLAVNLRERRWKGLILTGAEITLRRDLADLARRARDAGFEHVRIQTHGAQLADEKFAAQLVAAGVDEYFVSVAGPDAATHDAIVRVPGAFDKMIAGMTWLDAQPGVALLTNTVVTSLSYRRLVDVVEGLASLKRLRQMEFWVYWPMRESDEKQLIAPNSEVGPELRAALGRAHALGRATEVKNFPECLLGEHAGSLVNVQPHLYTDPAFWPEFMRNGFYQCVYRERCASKECLGLSTAYVQRFGWDENLLAPIH